MVKISVIVPCYNVEKYLKECLDSIVNQTLEDIEIICINDGSTDNTLNIINSYAEKDNRIKIINQTNQGLSKARNVGLENVTGEYTTFIDSDDYFDLTAFEEIYNLAHEKSLDLLVFKLINFDDDSCETYSEPYYDMEFLKENMGPNVFSHEDIGEDIYKMSVTAPSKLFKTDLIKDMKFPEGLIFEDNPFFTEVMFKSQRVYFYDKYLYYRRVRSDSITHAYTNKFYHMIEILNMIDDITKKYGFYEEYRYRLYTRKISILNNYFKLLNEEDKAFYFQKLKKDFKEHEEEYKSSEVFHRIPRKFQAFFDYAIYLENYEEYQLKTENYELNILNKQLRRQNKKLKKEIKSLRKHNRSIENSTSWKIAKTLRRNK